MSRVEEVNQSIKASWEHLQLSESSGSMNYATQQINCANTILFMDIVKSFAVIADSLEKIANKENK